MSATTAEEVIDDVLPEPTPAAVPVPYAGASERVWSFLVDKFEAGHDDQTVIATADGPDGSPLVLGDLRMVVRSQDEHVGEDGQWWGNEDCFERECEDYTGHDEGGLDPQVDFPCSHLTWVPAWALDAIRAEALAAFQVEQGDGGEQR